MIPSESSMTDPTNRERRVGLATTPPLVMLESVRKAAIRRATRRSRMGGQPIRKWPSRGCKCEFSESCPSECDGGLSLGGVSTEDTPVGLGLHNASRIAELAACSAHAAPCETIRGTDPPRVFGNSCAWLADSSATAASA